MDLSDALPIRIQFIPGHKDIKGNEIADGAARTAHQHERLTEAPLPREEMVSLTMKHFKLRRQSVWTNSMSVTERGKRLSAVRDTVGHWQWAYHNSRVIECALTRIRIGHAGVNKHHLKRFGM